MFFVFYSFAEDKERRFLLTRLPGGIHRQTKKRAEAVRRGCEGVGLSIAQKSERGCFDDNGVFLEGALPGAYDLTIQHHRVRKETAARV
jgi:hypothetical protein